MPCCATCGASRTKQWRERLCNVCWQRARQTGGEEAEAGQALETKADSGQGGLDTMADAADAERELLSPVRQAAEISDLHFKMQSTAQTVAHTEEAIRGKRARVEELLSSIRDDERTVGVLRERELRIREELEERGKLLVVTQGVCVRLKRLRVRRSIT